MPYLVELIAAGSPEDLLLSVTPPDAPWTPFEPGEKDPRGKKPARFDPETGRWPGLQNWTFGEPPEHREVSDKFNCNFGMLTGQPRIDRHGVEFTAIGIDGDITDDPKGIARLWRPRLLQRFAEKFGMPDLLIRNTRDVRFMVLGALEPGGNVGAKVQIKIWHQPKGEAKTDLGEMELLGKGCQVVIAGRHQSGNQITWTRLNAPRVEYSVPTIDDGIPIFAHFDGLRQAVTEVLASFEGEGFHFSIKHDKTRTNVGASRDPEYLAPPDAASFCGLVDRIPNPSDTSRDTYTDMWFATTGCRNALKALNRATPEELFEMERAMLDWCERWEPPPPHRVSTREEEQRKAIRDFYQRPMISIGWRRIQEIAHRLGVPEVAYEAAVEDFGSFEMLPAPPPPLAITATEAAYMTPNARMPLEHAAPDANEVFLIGPKTHRGALDVQLSDSQISDSMTDDLMSNAIWVVDEKRWMFYDRQRGWDGSTTAGNRVRNVIDNLLWKYASQFADTGAAASERWTRGERVGVLSRQRVKAIEGILQDRLAKPRSGINQATAVLQTPVGAFNLRDGSAIPLAEQKRLLDTRCTLVAPLPGPTPLWDELLFNLSDGNPRVMEWIKHYFGYALLGDPRARIFLYIHGTSGNGKSALVRILKGILLNYCVILDKDIFLQSAKDKHPTSLYRIRDAIFAFALEMPKGERWNAELLKKLTGMDEIQARAMHQNMQSFISNAALLLSGNDVPVFEHIDQSIAARVRIAGTNFKPAVEDTTFDERVIREEGPAILHSLMQYAQAVFKAGIKLPEVPAPMLRKAAEVLGSQDPFFAWQVAELNMGREHADCAVQIAVLKARYEAFLKRKERDEEENDFDTDSVTTAMFLKKLRSIGLRTETAAGARVTVDGQAAVLGCELKLNPLQRSKSA